MTPSHDSTECVSRRLQCRHLPLAVYREVAAHLRQLDGVQVSLLPQTSQDFDYLQSQVGGIEIGYPAQDLVQTDVREQIDSILAYYRERYGPWERIA